MKMYNILGVMNGLNDNAKAEQLNESVKQETVYENVEPRGSIMDAVKSLGEKYMGFKKLDEAAKPDFLDVDKDGNKKEPFKKAVKDKKAVEEGTIAKPQTDLKKHSATAKRMAAQKKADKDWNDSQAAKQATNEGAGPYTLDDPKHPKFKANFEKYKKAHPDCTLAEFVAAMRKKEKGLAEGAYDEPEAPNADAIAKRKRLQALKDKQEDERDSYSDTKSNVRKVAGKAYGGAAQKDDVSDLDEVAPPGAKAERMVKHIKKGYAKDGKLSKKEKGIAYATAWKAKKAGVVEATQFGDKIANSKAELKKAKPAMVKESRVMEETDYFYEKVGKSLAEKNPHLNTADGEFVDAVRKEMIAQGIEPNRARNILLMDEDFIGDVATSYGHYCQVDTHHPLPDEIDLNEIARLAGLPVRETEVYNEVNHEQVEDTMDEDALGAAMGGIAGGMVGKSPAAVATGAKLGSAARDTFNDLTGLEELTAPPMATPGKAPSAKATGMAPAKGNVPPTPTFNEDDVAEGNEFSGALAKAKATGAKEFEVDGKKYTVKEDINVNITANGQEDALNLFRKLAGMDEVAPEAGLRAIGEPQDLETALAQGIIEPVEEERDIEYTNTPNEKIAGIGAAIPAGADLNRSKKQYKKEYPGDNPMAVREDVEGLWEKYSNMLKGLVK